MRMTTGDGAGTARVVKLSGRRLASVTLSVLAAPLALAACGMLGGSTNHGAAPVVIPTVVDSAGATDVPSSPSSTTTTTTTTTAATAAAAPPPATVTRTGIIVQTQVQVRTRTATRTMVPPTVTKTLPPATVTQTQLATVTPPSVAKTVTITIRCTATGVQQVCTTTTA